MMPLRFRARGTQTHNSRDDIEKCINPKTPHESPITKEEAPQSRFTTYFYKHVEFNERFSTYINIFNLVLLITETYLMYQMYLKCCRQPTPIEVLPSLFRADHSVMGLEDAFPYPVAVNMTVTAQELWERSDIYVAVPEIFTVLLDGPLEGRAFERNGSVVFGLGSRCLPRLDFHDLRTRMMRG